MNTDELNSKAPGLKTSNKQEGDIKLSLCIPTYNRVALLDQALDAITAQWNSELTANQRAQVQIVVSDNHSTDETPVIVARKAADHQGLYLTYFRQPENRGADANILTTIQKAEGEFVYLISDDDLLLSGALLKIFALIRDYPEADGFSLNARPFVDDANVVSAPMFRLHDDKRIMGGDASLQFLGTWVTFISAMAFRRARIAGQCYESRIGTSLLQSYIYLDVLAGNTEIVATRDPLLAVRAYNSGGFNFFEVFVTQFHSLMTCAENLGFAPQTVRGILDRHLRTYLTPYAVVMRVRESYGTFQPDFHDAARRLRAVYGFQPFLVFVTLPSLLAPLILIRGLHSGLKQAKNICHWILSCRARIVQTGA